MFENSIQMRNIEEVWGSKVIQEHKTSSPGMPTGSEKTSNLEKDLGEKVHVVIQNTRGNKKSIKSTQSNS